MDHRWCAQQWVNELDSLFDISQYYRTSLCCESFVDHASKIHVETSITYLSDENVSKQECPNQNSSSMTCSRVIEHDGERLLFHENVSKHECVNQKGSVTMHLLIIKPDRERLDFVERVAEQRFDRNWSLLMCSRASNRTLWVNARGDHIAGKHLIWDTSLTIISLIELCAASHSRQTSFSYLNVIVLVFVHDWHFCCVPVRIEASVPSGLRNTEQGYNHRYTLTMHLVCTRWDRWRFAKKKIVAPKVTWIGSSSTDVTIIERYAAYLLMKARYLNTHLLFVVHLPSICPSHEDFELLEWISPCSWMKW